eukprot:g4309.t1
MRDDPEYVKQLAEYEERKRVKEEEAEIAAAAAESTPVDARETSVFDGAKECLDADVALSDDENIERKEDELPPEPPLKWTFTGLVRNLGEWNSDPSCNTLQPGELLGAKVTHANLVVSTPSAVNVTFRTTNGVPFDGYVCVRFDSSFLEIKPTATTTRGISNIPKKLDVVLLDQSTVMVRATTPTGAVGNEEEEGGEEEQTKADASIIEADDGIASMPTSSSSPSKDLYPGIRVNERPGESEETGEAASAFNRSARQDLCDQNATIELVFASGIMNPKTPGVRRQGSRANRTYKIWTSTKEGVVIDEALGVPATKFTTSVSTESLMSFLFPQNQYHPKSTGRLIVLQRYGPLDENGGLRGGKFGGHAVSENELRCMLADVYREDLVRVYNDSPETLTEFQKEEVIKKATRPVREAIYRNVTPGEVRRMLGKIPKDSVGGVDFSDLQRAIGRFRRRRVRRCKNPSLEFERKSPTHNGKMGDSTVMLGRGGTNTSTSSRFIGGQGVKMHALEINDMKHKMLHTEACRICEIGGGNDPELTQNVILLRRDDPARDSGSAPWSKCTVPGHLSSCDLDPTGLQKQFPRTHLKLVRVRRLPPPRNPDLYEEGARRATSLRNECVQRNRDAYDRRRAVPF